MCDTLDRINLRVKDLQTKRDWDKAHKAIMQQIAHQNTCAICKDYAHESETRTVPTATIKGEGK